MNDAGSRGELQVLAKILNLVGCGVTLKALCFGEEQPFSLPLATETPRPSQTTSLNCQQSRFVHLFHKTSAANLERRSWNSRRRTAASCSSTPGDVLPKSTGTQCSAAPVGGVWLPSTHCQWWSYTSWESCKQEGSYKKTASRNLLCFRREACSGGCFSARQSLAGSLEKAGLLTRTP